MASEPAQALQSEILASHIGGLPTLVELRRDGARHRSRYTLLDDKDQ